jgi:hypothetical protein
MSVLSKYFSAELLQKEFSAEKETLCYFWCKRIMDSGSGRSINRDLCLER